MFKFDQLQAYDEAKKYLLYAEKIAERQIQPTDEMLAHKIKSSLVTVVANIARSTSFEDMPERKKENVIHARALLHEVAAGFDIAHDKRLVSDETFAKIKTKTAALLSSLGKS